MATPCYLVEYTDEQRVSLRRFGFGPDEGRPERHACPAREPWQTGYRPGCDASSADIATVPLVWSPESGSRKAPPDWPRDDPNWPERCSFCGEVFAHDEMWQANGAPIMRVVEALPGAALDAGVLATIDDLPPGAMWLDPYPHDFWGVGFDGRSLTVKLPTATSGASTARRTTARGRATGRTGAGSATESRRTSRPGSTRAN